MKIQLNLNIQRKKSQEKEWFTEELWSKIFPYIKCSAVWTHDTEPFWRYSDFLESIKYMESHSNRDFHGFGNSGDLLTDKLELASFLANFHQETGDPSLEVPYPWSYPKKEKKGYPYEGHAGGGLAIMEGSSAQVVLDDPVPSSDMKKTISLSNLEKDIIGTDKNLIKSIVPSLKSINQPNFGLGMGTGSGVILKEHYQAVSDNGTLVKEGSSQEGNSRNYTCSGPYCQYGGRGAIQLSYNYNYTDCSLALFNDLRLVQYPNLIITTDREKFNGLSFYFGFPGPNLNGANRLPEEIANSTPPARRLAFITCLWFWMVPRSGRKISCHYSMVNWKTHGITSCNMIINNQSGCTTSWAYNKILYYRRICKIFEIPDDIVQSSIVCPPNKEAI